MSNTDTTTKTTLSITSPSEEEMIAWLQRELEFRDEARSSEALILRAVLQRLEASRWRDIESAPKAPLNEAGLGPAILLRTGDFVISDQWKPGLPEYPLQSHWRNWPYVQPRTPPAQWRPIDNDLPSPPATTSEDTKDAEHT